MHVPKEQRTKLHSKAIEYIFLGYRDDKFGYRLMDLKNRKLIQSRDVVFREDQTFGDSKKKEYVPEEYARESFEERDKPPTSVREEWEARVDSSLPPPSDDGQNVDEFFYGVTNDVIDDVEQDEDDLHQREPGNLRK